MSDVLDRTRLSDADMALFELDYAKTVDVQPDIWQSKDTAHSAPTNSKTGGQIFEERKAAIGRNMLAQAALCGVGIELEASNEEIRTGVIAKASSAVMGFLRVR